MFLFLSEGGFADPAAEIPVFRIPLGIYIIGMERSLNVPWLQKTPFLVISPTQMI